MKVYVKIFTSILLALSLISCSTKQKDPFDDLTAPDLLKIGKQALSKSEYEKALAHFREIQARYPYSVFAQQATLETAYLYYRSGDPGQAIANADRFIFTYPINEHVDYAYYIKGLANYQTHRNFISKLTGSKDFSDRDQNNAKEAFDSFNELVTRFTNSRYKEDALERMKVLLNTIAKHETNIAQFYLQRGAYVAAINRAKIVVEQYQSTAAVEDALGMMIIAYREMGLNDLSQDSWRILKLNFPKSRYLLQIPAPKDSQG